MNPLRAEREPNAPQIGDAPVKAQGVRNILISQLRATDYGVRKGFGLTYGWKDLPHSKELLEYGEFWRPHRTVAAWYFRRELELPQGRGVKMYQQ